MQVCVQLCPLDMLKDQVQLSRCVNHVIQAHYILVLEFLKDIDFSDDTFLTIGLHQVIFFIDFNRKHEPSLEVNRLLDRSIRALAQVLPNLVV